MKGSDPAIAGKRPRSYLHRILKAIAALVLLAVSGIALLLVSLWLEHRTAIALPVPTGHFAVGRTTYEWVNNLRADELAPSAGAKREVLVWVWYPAAAAPSAKAADYTPAPWRIALERTSGVFMSRFLTRDPAVVQAHGSDNPQISREQASYPIVIMRAGGGALTTDFTTLAEDLASHGYVVAGFDAPYRTFVVVFKDGRVVQRRREDDPEDLPPAEQERLINKLLPMWTSDTQFVVDQLEHLNAADPSGRFTGRLDMQRLGMFGHSFGGATALQFCHDDSRCKAGIDIDGAPQGSVVKGGVTQPFLFLLSDHGDASADEARVVYADINSIYSRLPNRRSLLMIQRTNHFSFSDQILLKSHFVVGLLQLIQGGLDARRGLAITTAYVHTFFDVYLKQAPARGWDDLRTAYPEVRDVQR